ncbi:MAG: epimerase [Silicimonas sp.]|nr:epimerase [Silicimonas sp.]
MPNTVLILGANGRFGRHAAEAFWNSGWRVRLFDRRIDTLVDAAEGADLIVNAWNPPYPAWQNEVPKLTSRVIAVAKSSGATVLIPGNLYVYGKGSAKRLSPDTPHRATNPLGRVRIEMENAYRDAGVKTIVLRAGDFIDTEVSGNWFEGVITAKACKGLLVAPGHPNTMHAWAYLPDMAKAAVQLAEMRDRLETFEDVPFPGYALSLTDIALLASQATGRDTRIRRFPWPMIQLASMVWPMGRHLSEMRYLWNMSHEIDGARFGTLLPDFRGTPPVQAVARSLGIEIDVYPHQPVTRRNLGIAAE